MPRSIMASSAILGLSLLVCANPAAAQTTAPPQLNPDKAVDTITFGSCANQEAEQPIWDSIIANESDVFVWLGDNIYGDTEDMEILQAKYDMLAAQPGYQSMLATDTDVVATWDDHDYGQDDAGAEFPMKEESKQIFLDFFGEPADSERRTRDGGVYTSYLYGPDGQQVQIILPDLRWDRSPINTISGDAYAARVGLDGGGPYSWTVYEGAQMLGEEQWAWLEEQLRVPADVRIIGVSVPFLQDGTGWETWANFPFEREKLIDLIEETGADGVIFITGDTHWAQHSRRVTNAPYALWEVNSSGLTENWQPVPIDVNRVGDTYSEDNFGLIRIDWEQDDPEITMEIRDADDNLVMSESVVLSELRAAD